MVGGSPAWLDVRKVIERPRRPLLRPDHGRDGHGKELVARAIHRISGRRDGPFLKINGPRFPHAVGGEMFGYEKGRSPGGPIKAGRFELADGGNLLPGRGRRGTARRPGEIAPGPRGRGVRAGGGREDPDGRRAPDLRSNRDLKRETSLGRFREDLYYRVSGYRSTSPSEGSARGSRAAGGVLPRAHVPGAGRREEDAFSGNGRSAGPIPVARQHPRAGERRSRAPWRSRTTIPSPPPTCARPGRAGRRALPGRFGGERFTNPCVSTSVR